jgi:hypothetical protein
LRRYLSQEEIQEITNEGFSIPKMEEAVAKLVEKIKVIYKEFIDRGKFYDQKHHYEFGKRYVTIFESDGYGECYETIGDWAEELTGETKFFFGYTGETYRDLIYEAIREYTDSLWGDLYIDNIVMIENELEGEILDLPISVLEEQ